MDQLQYGGLLWHLTHHLMRLEPASNLHTIFSDIKSFYPEETVECQFRYFNKLTMFVRKSGPPKLRGKAAEIQGFCQVALKIWKKYMNPSIELHRKIMMMLQCNVQLEAIIQEYKDFDALPPEAAAHLLQACRCMTHSPTHVILLLSLRLRCFLSWVQLPCDVFMWHFG